MIGDGGTVRKFYPKTALLLVSSQDEQVCIFAIRGAVVFAIGLDFKSLVLHFPDVSFCGISEVGGAVSRAVHLAVRVELVVMPEDGDRILVGLPTAADLNRISGFGIEKRFLWPDLTAVTHLDQVKRVGETGGEQPAGQQVLVDTRQRHPALICGQRAVGIAA